jgi:hypothetical protein
MIWTMRGSYVGICGRGRSPKSFRVEVPYLKEYSFIGWRFEVKVIPMVQKDSL